MEGVDTKREDFGKETEIQESYCLKISGQSEEIEGRENRNGRAFKEGLKAIESFYIRDGKEHDNIEGSE